MNQRDSTLDLVRGMSALLVMLSHLRGFLFLDCGELQSAGVLTKAFYFATGLGHQAVMVFFVLSGYFVGGSILGGLRKGSFSWHAYATARLSRLWMVLIPALGLTFGLDWLGHHWNPDAYSGSLHERFMAGPSPHQPATHDGLTLIGNLAFLQNVSVPVYGTNGPLWSLANEFWYYVLFPLLAVGISGGSECRSWPSRVFKLGIATVIVLGLPRELVLSGLIWLMGVGVWWLIGEGNERRNLEVVAESGSGTRPRLCRIHGLFFGWVWRIVGGLLFFGALAASKSGHWLGSDYVVGGAFALWMLSMPGCRERSCWWRSLSTGLSEISYTLYVVHFPLMFLVSCVLVRGGQMNPGPRGFLWFGGLAIVVLGTSIMMWWGFERNTLKVRRWVERRLLGRQTINDAQ